MGYKGAIAPRWAKLGFPTTRNLANWLSNLKERCEQLNDWIAEPLTIPKVVDISKLFNPCSFLTAIKQLCCQQQQLELDKLDVFTDVTKKYDPKSVDAAARDVGSRGSGDHPGYRGEYLGRHCQTQFIFV